MEAVEQVAQQEAEVIEVFERRGEGVGNRAAAWILDQGIVSAAAGGLTAILFFVLSPFSPTSAEQLLGQMAVVFGSFWLLIGFVYFTVTEWKLGGSPAKLYGMFPLSMHVISADGGALSWRQAFLRWAVGLLESNPLLLGLPAALFAWARHDRTRLGDRVAGTLVVDRSKLHTVRLLPAGPVELEHLDGSVTTLAALDEGFVSTWLGKPQYLVLRGRTTGGAQVRVRALCVGGFTVFSDVDAMVRVRQALEHRFARGIPNKLQTWRVALLVVMFLLSAISMAAVFMVLVLSS